MEKSICLLVLLLSLGAVLAVPSFKPGGRIINGDEAAPGQFPFIVGLEQSFMQFCDGSIINNRWILTAASCVQGLKPDYVIIVAGTHHFHTGGNWYNISSLIYHPGYNNVSLENNIGLIEVDPEIVFDDLIQPIEIGDVEANDMVTALGWGENQNEYYPEELTYIEVRALSLEECQERAKNDMGNYYLGPEEVCTLSDDTSKGVCSGDGGGPLILNGKLVGIISYGFKPCAKGLPDVYIRPTAYIDWINSYIKK